MQTQAVQPQDASRQIGKLLDQVHYQNKPLQIESEENPTAWLVGENFMQIVGEAIEYMIEHNPSLADTMAITLDDEIREAIEESRKELAEGKKIPLESILE